MSAVTLDFIARQQQYMLATMGELRDDMAIMMAMLQRLDGTVSGLVNEVRAMHARHNRLARRVDAMAPEDRP